MEVVLISPSIDGDLIEINEDGTNFIFGDLILVPSRKGFQKQNILGIFLDYLKEKPAYYKYLRIQTLRGESGYVGPIYYQIDKTIRLCKAQEYSIEKLSSDESNIYSKGEEVGVRTRKLVRYYDRKALSYEVLIGNKKIWKNDY